MRNAQRANRPARIVPRASSLARRPQTADNRRLSGGFPHSDIPGSKGALASPGLIAECHVLHRLLPPRHPPNALLALDPIRKKTGPLVRRSCDRQPILLGFPDGSHFDPRPHGSRLKGRKQRALAIPDGILEDLSVSVFRLGKTVLVVPVPPNARSCDLALRETSDCRNPHSGPTQNVSCICSLNDVMRRRMSPSAPLSDREDRMPEPVVRRARASDVPGCVWWSLPGSNR